ncbi:CD2-associated protein [Schistosoma japonicum]|nr:CD2-associated protein [Schistosoma japonicum]
MEVVVEYDYTAEENDELTIKKGDIIKDVSQFEEGWYIGCLNGRIGVFPDNFVKVKSSVQPKVPVSHLCVVKGFPYRRSYFQMLYV